MIRAIFKVYFLFSFAGLYLSLVPLPTYAQSNFTKENFLFEHFTLPGGILANQVQQVVQDQNGFLWFGTKGGLIKYDGRDFKTFEANPQDTSIYKTNYIESLLIDSEGMLWVGTYGGGLSKLNPYKEAYISLDLKLTKDIPRIDRYIYTILEDQSKNIWLGTSKGLFKIQSKTLEVSLFSADKEQSNQLNNNIIWNLYEDRSGTIWVGTGFPWEYAPSNGGLHRYNATTNDFTRFLHRSDDLTSISDNRIKAIYEDSKNNFWVGSMGSSLDLMDRKSGTFERLDLDYQHPIKISKPSVKASSFTLSGFSQTTFIHEDALGHLWIGAFNGGLNIYDPNSNVQLHFEAEDAVENGISTNFLFNIFETKDRTIFLCSGDGGDNKVTKVTYSNNLFERHSLPKENTNKGFVQNMVEDEIGNIWVGTLHGEGLFKWQPSTNQIDKHPQGLRSKNMMSISSTQDGKLWLGYTDDGFQVIDPTTKNIIPSPFPKEIEENLSKTSINACFKDSKGNYWLPTRFSGIYKLSPNQAITHFMHHPEQSDYPYEIGGATIDRIVEDEKGFIWLFGAKKTWDGIYSITIDQYNPIDDSIKSILKSNQENGFVSCIARDKAGNFWFPNGLDGIKKLDIETNKITTVNTTNSRIPDDEIRALSIDNQGIIWMSTETKIAAYNPESESFRIFDHLDGVNLELSFGAICKMKNGHLLFGGKNGFLEIDPAKINWDIQHQQPDIKITELKVNNKLVALENTLLDQQPIWKKSLLDFAPNQNNFSFGLSTTDYQSNNNYIEYFLENYDSDWRIVGPEQQANYVNVPPGNYILKTRGANAKGGWNPAGQSIRINVNKPWWQKWWAYTIGISFFLAAIYLLYRFQLNRQKTKQETENLKKLDALKTKLYANITHEFRTPLTLIMGLADQLKNQATSATITSKAITIERNGKQLLFLVNQLLDLRQLEAGKVQVNYLQGNILPSFHYYYDNFNSLAESKRISIEKDFPSQSIIMDFDADYLYKIVANLLSNAIKFTQEGGTINFSVRKIEKKLIIKIKDNGAGIPSEHLPYIFDRFYRSEYTINQSGTGIGLALSKELVQLLKGKIEVQSTPQVGSEFTITLPITNKATLAKKETPSTISTIPSKQEGTQLLPPLKKENAPIILIVEDNPEIANFTASCLANYIVYFAKDGQQGIEKAAELIPDLIISDVMMPNKDGFQLCEILKTDEKTSHIPIILLTARAEVEDRITGLKRGADAYIGKPFHEEELKARAAQLIAQRALLKARYADLSLQKPSMDATLKIEDEFVLKVRALIEENLDNEAFSVHDISSAIFLSRAQVHRKLKALTNKSTGQFIRTIRLHHALAALQNTNKSVAEVAYEVGFKDPAYFSRVFTEEFGRPPSKVKV